MVTSYLNQVESIKRNNTTVIFKYSGIQLKSTPQDQKRVLTLSKVDLIHFQETSQEIHIIRTACLPFIIYDNGLLWQCLHFVTYNYSVINL